MIKGNKKNWILLTFAIFIVFSIANVSAGIYFSQLDSVYNLGDMIEMNVNVTPDNAGPLRVVLVCDNNTLDVYKGAPTELIQLPLTSLWMNGMTGDCFFKGYYSGEIKDSTHFKISKKLDIMLQITAYFAKPGEVIKIAGNVKRLNGEPINGEIEVNVPLSLNNENSKELISGIISNGAFSIDYTIRPQTPAGNYGFNVLAYEKTTTERTSEGLTVANVQVSQVIKNIDIAIDSQDLEPGKTIGFKPILNDQAGNPLIGDVAIEIRDIKLNRIFQRIVKSGEKIDFTAPANMTPGYYEIEAISNSLTKTKRFHVSEKPLVSFNLVNGTLVIKNIGNAPYNKTIEVKINNQTYFIKPSDFGDAILPGDKREFKLRGNKETNSVLIDDKVTNLTEENVILPMAKNSGFSNINAAAVGVSDLIYTPITWIIILVILAAIILFLFRDIFKKKSFAYPAQSKNQFVRTQPTYTSSYANSPVRVIKLDNKGKEINTIERARPSSKEEIGSKSDKNFTPIPPIKPFMEKNTDYKDHSHLPYKPYNKESYNKEVAKEQPKENPIMPKSQDIRIIGQIKPQATNQAEQVLVTDGQKSRAAVIALKIKNTINKFSKENLEKSIEHVYEKKGAVYEHGNFIFVIFSPIITKTFRNEIDATKSAEKIAEGLKEHNRKFSEKIEYGISVNSGEIINKIENKKLKFTSLGTLTIAAKKLAELSNGEVLLTKEAYEKAMTEVKADKSIINGTEVYIVKKVADYDRNKKFINDFLKREGEIKSRNMIPNHEKEPKSNPYWMKDEVKKQDDSLSDITRI